MSKRIVLLLAALCCWSGLAWGQLLGGPNVKSLEKKLRKSDEAIQDAKKSKKPSTWQSRGDLLVEVREAERMGALLGIDLPRFQLERGAAVEQRTEMVGDKECQVLVMSRASFYFHNGVLLGYRVTAPIAEGALDRALEAYGKAYELEEREGKRKGILDGLRSLRMTYIQEGVNAAELGDHAAAAGYFGQALTISSRPEIGIVDTLIYYNQGLELYNAGRFDEALVAMEKAASLGYTQDGMIYCTLYLTADRAGKTEQGVQYLREQINHYPHQKCLALHLVQHSVKNNEDPSQVLPYLDRAIANDPKNAVLLFVRGVVLEKIEGKQAETEKAYNDAIALDPKFRDAYYNLAILHYNLGVEEHNRASNLPVSQQKEYDEMMARATGYFRECMAVGERLLSVELDSESDYGPMLDLLKSVYFRFRREEGMQAKYDAVVARLEKINGGK